MSSQEYLQANASSAVGNQTGTIVAGDYHNGPLSTLIPFGIWGAIGFIWLLWSGGRVLYFNYRYGDPAVKTINTSLLAAYLTKSVVFLFVVGSFHAELVKFCGFIGLSIALNGGIQRAPVAEPASDLEELELTQSDPLA
jgi:hypothetical protein